MAFSIGDTLQDGKYHLDTLLDQRQWGMTFLATHQGVAQQVIIKTFQVAEDGPCNAQVQSYIDYAQKLTRFHHPHLSRVISVFEETGQACMVSEFILGDPLSQLIQSNPLDDVVAVRYIRQVAQGLHALHRHGLLHLNLSPSRILTRQADGKAVLIGLNSRFASDPAERMANPYLGLEQHQMPATIGIASEIYSIAAILYTLVTGQAPVSAADRQQTPLAPPSSYCAELNQSLEEAILKGMALDPRDRPQRMQDWIQMLPAPHSSSTTTLQVPSAWQVKLPAFREAGVQQPVSTQIVPPQPQHTTLQVSTPHASDPVSVTSGHPEANALPAELTLESSPVAEMTTLQLQVETLPVADGSMEGGHSIHSSSEPTSTENSASESSVSASVILSTPHHDADMSAKYPALSRKNSIFPKWALFWCALIAACGGLAAGLWLRLQLTRQFATTPVQESPFDELKTLDTKEEKFLPTQTSIIPEEKSENEGEVYDFESSPSPSDQPNSGAVDSEIESTDAALDERPISDDGRFPSSWKNREGQRSVDGYPGYPSSSLENPALSGSVDVTNPSVSDQPTRFEDEPFVPESEQPIEPDNVDPGSPGSYSSNPVEEIYRSDNSAFDANSNAF